MRANAAKTARGFVAFALAVLLGAGPLAPVLAAWSDNDLPSCALHGRKCTCPEMCMRGEHGHGHASAAESAVPACHRSKSAAGKSSTQPKCEIRGCGDGDSGIAAQAAPRALPGPESAVQAAPAPASVRIVLADAADVTDFGGKPPIPPPRSFC